MSKLKLLLMGHFECLLPSGEPVSLSMRKAEVLLAYLALAPGIRHPRERLINLLWSDRADEQARNSLRQCLSAIRKSLGDAAELVLQVERTSVCLKANMIEVDALEFERLAAGADFESLTDAAALYRGEFLEGVGIRDAASQEWLDNARARFKRQYIEILTNLGYTLLASRDYAQAIQNAERLVEQDPLSESGWRVLMRAYHENGDRGHALQAFKRCQQVLRNDLGVDPEAETIALREQIATGKPGTAAEESDSRSASEASTNRGESVKVDAGSNPGGSRSHGIAVLPFDNLSGDPEQEYFSDGITDSIILNLSLFPGLRVKSRNSSFAFKQQLKGLAEISSELDVDYLVEGSVRRAAGRIRVNVQLIEAASGDQVWGKRYDSDLEDLFALEEDLSRSVAATVTGQIDSELQRIAVTKNEDNPQSYDLLLQGIYHASRNDASSLALAIEKLNESIALEPNNARAHANLAFCYQMGWIDRWMADLDAARALCGEHALKAIELDPALGMAHVACGEFLLFSHQLDKARAHFQKALDINPNDSEAVGSLAIYLSCSGRFEEAVEQAERALRLDPYHRWARWIMSEALFFCGRYPEVLETIDEIGNPPGFIQVYRIAALIELEREIDAHESLQHFLRFSQQSMANAPRTRDEWLAYSRVSAPFADPAINERLVDYLVRAGLDPNASPAVPSADANNHNIAVLPFDNLSGDPEQEYFSDGITESITLNLALFPGLQVKSRNSSFAFKQQLKGLVEISRELDVDYIVEGSVRKSKDRIRITAQLIDAASGNQLWGKRYDADLTDLFDLEEELSREIAATVTGRIKSELQRIAIAKGAADQQAYDLLLAGMYYVSRFNGDDNVIAIEKFERCLAQDPDNVRAHVGLYICYSMAYLGRWIENYQHSYDMAWIHIRRALQLDPEDRAAQVFHGEMLAFSGELDKARKQIDKVLMQNPNDTDALAVLAMIRTVCGDAWGGHETAEHTLKLDPFHPWAGWELAVAQFYCGNYEGTLEAISTMRATPGFINLYTVAALVKLGRIEQAQETLREFMHQCDAGMKEIPRNIDEWFQYTRQNYPFADEQLNHDLVDSMVQAGLEEMLPPDSSHPATDSLPSIAVLPLKNLSGDSDQEYFSDGVTSSVILGMGMFKGLRVKSQNSSFAYRDSHKSSTEIATELGVDFLVEGSMRKSGNRIRLAVQLVETESDTQIWGKQYDAELDDILELEQKLSSTIAGTISGRIGHTLQKTASHKPAKNLRSYDYLLRGLYHFGKFTANDLAIARDMIEKCLEIDPDNATAHSNLGTIHSVELIENWSTNRELSDQRAAHHLQLAIELEPENALAHAYLSEYLMLIRRDYAQSEFHADKAIECNPTASEGYVAKTDLLGWTRRVDEAVPYADKALELDPHSVGAGWAAGDVYRKAGMHQQAIKTFRSISHPPASVHALVAACFVEMELLDEAHRAMQVYRQMAKQEMYSFPNGAAEWQSYWRRSVPFQHDEDFAEFFNLLVDAGLLDDAGEAAGDLPSIAVLPFENMSDDPEQAFFSDGITADIISTLAKFKHLHTVARHSTEIYRERKASIAEIAAEQGVRYILEGNVRRSGKRIRVSAELIDSQDEQVCWSERYDRDLDDLFAVQDEITQKITLAMKVQLDDGEKASRRSAGTTSIKAWELTLTAVDLQDTYIQKNIVESRAMLQQAIELDPGYCYAWIFVGWTHWQEAYSGWCESFTESMRAARAAVDKALELEPDNGEAWSLAGTLQVMNHDAEKAIAHNREALRLEPGNAEVHALAGFAMNFVGDYESAGEHFRKALQLGPLCPNWYYGIGAQAERATGNPDSAIALLRRGVEVETDSPMIRFFLADALLDKGDEPGARRVAGEIRRLDKFMTGKGLVQCYSHDASVRERFRRNLESLGLV